MIFFKDSYAEVTYDQAANAVTIVWTTSPTSEEFRTGMNKLIEAMETHKTGRLLTDSRNLGAISEEDQAWSLGEWVEKANKVGYEKLAIIISKDIFSKMSVEDIMDNVNEGVSFQYFDDTETARAWLVGNDKTVQV